MSAVNKTGGQYVEWLVRLGEKDNKKRKDIVIPKDGIYFVYVTIDLLCSESTASTSVDVKKFFLQLRNWNERYPVDRVIGRGWSGVKCTAVPMTVFVGKMFELLEGDHVSVWIEEGVDLVMDAAFGAHLA